jgi:hypothetical protein
MTSGVFGFVNIWAPSISSTNNRIEVRNITQGGNDLLAALPMGCQAMWASSVLAQVAEVTTGPLSLVAQAFRIIFHPVIGFPLSIVSCAVKEHFYESSIKCPVPEQIKYYERGAPVAHHVAGTVSLPINGQLRHFIIGGEMSWAIENSALFEVDGVMKRFRYVRLGAEELYDENCRELELDGARVRVRLDYEVEGNFTEIEVGGRRRWYRLGNEVAEPVQGSVADPAAGWRANEFLLGNEIPNEAPNCIKVRVEPQVLHYDVGKEIDAPTDTSRSLMIDGQLRHFANAKYVSSPSHGLSGWLNKIPKLPFKLPTKLSKWGIEVLEFVNRNMSNVIRIALVVSGAVLLFFGHTAMAAGTLLAVSYEYLDHDLGIVPRNVSLFMEKWMPVISMVGLLITGSLFSQVMAGVTLTLMIPSVNLMVHQRIGAAIRKTLLGLEWQIVRWFTRGERPPQMDRLVEGVRNYPLLEECDAPLVQRRHMNAEEIAAVLRANNNDYEINPAFLTKDFEPQLNLPENTNFSELTRLWDQVGVRWTEPLLYNKIFTRLVSDKRFILYLKERFPTAKRFFFEEDWRLDHEQNRIRHDELARNHRAQFQEWAGILAREKGFATTEAFVVDWVKQQLQCFVGKLAGDRPIEGEQHYLRDAVQNTSRILPFLLNAATPEFEKEDTLIHLSIEAGDYCALGMRRATKESLQGFAEPLLAARPGMDVNKAFEEEVLYTMQKARLAGIQLLYREITSRLRESEEMQDTADDVHLYEAAIRSLKRSFYHLNEEELEKFSLTELILKETLALPLHVQLMEMANQGLPMTMAALAIDPLDRIFGNRVLRYLRAWVQGNNALSPQEKEALLNGDLMNDPDHIADPDNHPKWHRLMNVILGVLREKRAALLAAPAPIPAVQPVLPAVVRV